MANEEKSTLVFIFAVDTDFLNKTAAPILVDVEPEMEHLAEFLLLMAQERAAKAGVEAEAVVKTGSLRDVLIEAATEHKASLIVLGSPGEEQNHFKLEDLQAFADGLREASGVKVKIV
jgi:nucleotide-binding universal stress UspA family protein